MASLKAYTGGGELKFHDPSVCSHAQHIAQLNPVLEEDGLSIDTAQEYPKARRDDDGSLVSESYDYADNEPHPKHAKIAAGTQILMRLAQYINHDPDLLSEIYNELDLDMTQQAQDTRDLLNQSGVPFPGGRSVNQESTQSVFSLDLEL